MTPIKPITPREAQNKFEDRAKHFRSMACDHSFVCRIYDGADTGGKIKDSRPCDFIVTALNETWYAEVKSFSDATRFPFGNLRKSQRIAAANILIARGRYIVHIYHQLSGKWYDIDYQVILDKMKNGEKSMTIADLEFHNLEY